MARGDLIRYLETSPELLERDIVRLGTSIPERVLINNPDIDAVFKDMQGGLMHAIAKAATQEQVEWATVYRRAYNYRDDNHLYIARVTLSDLVQHEGFQTAEDSFRLDESGYVTIQGLRVFWGQGTKERFTEATGQGAHYFDFIDIPGAVSPVPS